MKYLKIPMVNNRFMCQFTADFEHETTVDIDAIIDTGCTYSHISADLFYIFWQDEEKERMKEKTKWMQCRKSSTSCGLESFNKNIDKTLTPKNPRVIIAQRFYNTKVNGIGIGNRIISVSYDTSMVALIGMEILKDWDIHISKSLKTGQTLLIACPLDKINQEYINVLIEEFDIGQQVIKKLTDKIDYEALEASCIKSKLN